MSFSCSRCDHRSSHFPRVAETPVCPPKCRLRGQTCAGPSTDHSTNPMTFRPQRLCRTEKTFRPTLSGKTSDFPDRDTCSTNLIRKNQRFPGHQRIERAFLCGMAGATVCPPKCRFRGQSCSETPVCPPKCRFRGQSGALLTINMCDCEDKYIKR